MEKAAGWTRGRSGANELERLDVPGEFPSPQTPALSADEKTLYVPDYLRGIAAMDLATRAVKWLPPAENVALSGIDGLYVFGDSFLAVQNGTAPPRLTRFSLDLQKQEVLEANWPELGDPTHGVIVGDAFYFIANSGWGEYDQHGKIVWDYAVPLFGQKPRPGHGPEAFGNSVFAALRLPNGNTLIATGNGHSVPSS